MPSLRYHFQQADFGLLRIFAYHWGVSGPFSNAGETAQRLEAAFQEPERLAEVLESLPDNARQALAVLQAHGGRMPWMSFERQFGPFREMGPARRDRERPHEQPISPLETLWYAGLVGRAFLPTDRGPVEFAYIPDEIYALLPQKAPSEAVPEGPLGHPASAEEAAFPWPLHDRILDHFTTYLAARRAGLPVEQAPDYRHWRYTPEQLEGLAQALNLCTPEGVAPEAVRDFLSLPRGKALLRMFTAWRESAFNDLKHMPGVIAEGAWQNDPRRAREAVLGWLARLPDQTWWSLESFVAAVKQCCPDFQRPAPGDYDSWYLRDATTGRFLRGWEDWDAVDGALIRFIITGPLAWMGVVALASTRKGEPAMAFRVSPWGRALLVGEAPTSLPREREKLLLRSDGRILAPWGTPRVVRYHIARFAIWEGSDRRGYRFRLNAEAMARAQTQGIQPAQVKSLLQKHAQIIPPSILKAINRWEKQGTQAHIRPMLVLQVRDPAILDALRRSRAARFLGPVLGPAAVAVRAEAGTQVLAVLAELGYFGKLEEK